MGTLKIKVCGMRDRENIRKVGAVFPDYMGFIFYSKSKRYVGKSPDLFIFEELPDAISKVGVFVNEVESELVRISKTYGLEVAQLHGAESPDYCRRIKEQGLGVFKAFSVDDTFDFSTIEEYQDVVDYFLFDTKGKLPGGTGQKFNWNILKNYQLDVPFFLSGGIGPDDLKELLCFTHNRLWGLDINSGFETKPALKDASKVSSFVKEIRK